MASDLSTLITSLREAREGSRELDRDIYEFAIKGRTERVKHDVIAGPYTTDLTAAVALCERLFGTARMKEIFKGALEAWNPADGVKAFVLQFVIAILTAKDQAP